MASELARTGCNCPNDELQTARPSQYAPTLQDKLVPSQVYCSNAHLPSSEMFQTLWVSDASNGRYLMSAAREAEKVAVVL